MFFIRLLILLILPIMLSASPLEDIPVSYKGRFRPAEAYARLWLYNLYHAQTLKPQYWQDFKTQTGSAIHLLWQFHVFGSAPFQTAPLFWIGSAELKSILNLDAKQLHFNYHELYDALYEYPETSQKVFQQLFLSHFFKAYEDPSNRSRAQTLELTQFLPGLWAQLEGEKISVLATPAHFPWPQIKIDQSFDLGSFHKQQKLTDELLELIFALREFEALTGASLIQEQEVQDYVKQLKEQHLSLQDIHQALERNYPLLQRLRSAGTLWKVLPGRYQKGEWFSLHALKVQVYNSKNGQFRPISNFTLFSDTHFQKIRNTYIAWEQALLNKATASDLFFLQHHFLTALDEAYQDLEDQPYQEAQDKFLVYPSKNQLRWEAFYYQYPLILIAILLYSFAALALFCSERLQLFKKEAFVLLVVAFAFHTFLLLLRCYILQRPPVSNMFETVVYVPWISVLTSLILRKFWPHNLILMAAAIVSIILLVILQVTDLHHGLENVQAVLDSQFWLIIHVLMVVGSYGVFLLGGILGHLYLFSYLYHQKETSTMRILAQGILQTLYLGTALLILGTILGGVWAAESWGRFWDWDPKESWAFISSCLYLIWIHAYRFHKIAHFGLAIGAIAGFLAISFTWYGVNYILGTGLHSYGFGSGGDIYYYGFLGLETIFLSIALSKYRSSFNRLSAKS